MPITLRKKKTVNQYLCHLTNIENSSIKFKMNGPPQAIPCRQSFHILGTFEQEIPK